jgi:hypothetical protein
MPGDDQRHQAPLTEPRHTACGFLETLLALLPTFMPFITEAGTSSRNVDKQGYADDRLAKPSRRRCAALPAHMARPSGSGRALHRPQPEEPGLTKPDPNETVKDPASADYGNIITGQPPLTDSIW